MHIKRSLIFNHVFFDVETELETHFRRPKLETLNDPEK